MAIYTPSPNKVSSISERSSWLDFVYKDPRNLGYQDFQDIMCMLMWESIYRRKEERRGQGSRGVKEDTIRARPRMLRVTYVDYDY